MATTTRRRRSVKPRAKARVEDTESSTRVRKDASHRGSATVLDNGNVEIAYQLSELVPVAQYASVTIGPVQLRWQAQNPGIDKLGPVDWDDDTLTAEQQRVYDTVRGWLRATSKLIEHSIAEDREIIEESVRLHNEREAEEEAKAAKKRPKRR
jgi:hypothetical protein